MNDATSIPEAVRARLDEADDERDAHGEHLIDLDRGFEKALGQIGELYKRSERTERMLQAICTHLGLEVS